MMSRIAVAALLLAGGTTAAEEPAGPAFAPLEASAEGVRALASNCAACHGPEGRPAPGSTLAALAGRPAGEIQRAMAAYRAGEKPGTVMPQIAKGYTEAEIEAMARHFAGAGAAR